MKISIGENVMYGSMGVCQVDGYEQRSLKDKSVIEYYRLKPCNSGTSTYFVPCEPLTDKSILVRRLLTKDEILALIDSIPEIEPAWADNVNERKALFADLKSSDDYKKLFSMLKSIYGHREECISSGKKLLSADERAMKNAEELVNMEFGFVLGIKPEEVEKYIADRLADK